MTVSVCVPVLKRYDLLRGMLLSLEKSAIKVDVAYVLDNGRNQETLNRALDGIKLEIWTHAPEKPMGVAESWNWFLRDVPEERIIANDDVLFAPETVGLLLARTEPLVLGCGFSCFVLRDACVDKVGYFDEEISPGYAYYEDEDYMTRVLQLKVPVAGIECGVEHLRSSTLVASTPAELEQHHRKFRRAMENYRRKHGGLPGEVKAKFS